MEIKLKYGCNLNQAVARIVGDRDDGPLAAINGQPGYINILDGLRGWQLVRELKAATGKPAAASFKHVSPAGAAVAGPLGKTFCDAQFLAGADLSPIAVAYAKARSSDRTASFGDFVCVSDPVDPSLAGLLKPLVSDGIIAPAYHPEALKVLKQKKAGQYVVLQMDPEYHPPDIESRTEFGLRLEQARNDAVIDRTLLTRIVTTNRDLPDDLVETAIVATITVKHTQSNSICIGCQGQAVGVGAGQQSRIACTRLACDKAERWMLQQHPKVLSLKFADRIKRMAKFNVVDQFLRWDALDATERQALGRDLTNMPQPIAAQERAEWIHSFDGMVLSSDAFIPFRDNIDRAASAGVTCVVQTGGSLRDGEVIAAANEHGMVMAFTGLRLFLH